MDILTKINWKIRFMNPKWVLSLIAAIFVLVVAVGKLFGYELDLNNLQDNIVNIVYAIFGILAVIGVTMDPTTPGYEDSERALHYETPGELPENEETENE